MAVIAVKEAAMSSRETPETPIRKLSQVENAMSANARSRDRQGKAEDQARLAATCPSSRTVPN
jgi:hypothetical protein